MQPAGKGIKGFVPRQPDQVVKPSSPSKRSRKPTLAKVVVGNKQMMAQESIHISQTVDDYMREKEVSFGLNLQSMHVIAIDCILTCLVAVTSAPMLLFGGFCCMSLAAQPSTCRQCR